VIKECPTDDGVKVTLQVPEDRVQLVALKVPVLLLVKVTVPVGVTAPVPEESATVAVQVLADPVPTEDGEQATVVVLARMVEARVNVPLLPVWIMSPP
jgi:hypothetical protein